MDVKKLKKRSEVKETESPIEDILLQHLYQYGFHDVVPQYPIGKYRADFAFPSKRLIIECDGREYHSTPEQLEKDKQRDDFVREHGWQVFRFSGRRIVNEPVQCVKEILAAWYPRKSARQIEWEEANRVNDVWRTATSPKSQSKSSERSKPTKN